MVVAPRATWTSNRVSRTTRMMRGVIRGVICGVGRPRAPTRPSPERVAKTLAIAGSDAVAGEFVILPAAMLDFHGAQQ